MKAVSVDSFKENLRRALRLAIPVVSLSAEVAARDLDTLDEWLKAS